MLTTPLMFIPSPHSVQSLRRFASYEAHCPSTASCSICKTTRRYLTLKYANMELHSNIPADLLGLASAFCLECSNVNIVIILQLCDQASHPLNRPSAGQLTFFVLTKMAQLAVAEYPWPAASNMSPYGHFGCFISIIVPYNTERCSHSVEAFLSP